MPRSRRSGQQQPEEFTIRWHSVANMATPSADIMSSPDPLIDSPTTHSIVPPSSRRSSRVTRSLRSSRFLSTEKSPRKQMFELEVGDGKAPQKLLVTVETENSSTVKSARRKLFQQSSPMSVRRRAERAAAGTTTTTTVPLRDSIEDEIANATITPRRRGRPRKSNGTPMPSAGTKRKASTPARRTPRQPRATRTDEVEDAPEGDGAVQPTPTPKRRGRPPRSRTATVEPLSEPGSDFTQSGTGTRRTGRRRQAFIPDELEELVDEVANNASIQDEAEELPPSDDSVDLIMAPDDVDLITAPDEDPRAINAVQETALMATDTRDADELDADLDAGADAGADDDSDIWMATLSNDATPRAPAQRAIVSLSPAPVIERSPSQHDDDAEVGPSGHYYPAGAGSDISSLDDHIPRTNDTIAQGEDFSMIFMDSIPSLQASLHADSLPLHAYEEIGEETNIIINNTLESLRQSFRQETTQELDMQVEETIVEPEVGADEPDLEPEQNVEPDPDAIEAVVTVERESTPSRSDTRLSPGRSPASRWSRSPRKTKDSPLRRQALKFTARQAEEQVMSQGNNAEQTDERTEPTDRHDLTEQLTDEQSNIYEDSFSEIPQNVLAAATPRRPVVNTTDNTVDAQIMTVPRGASIEEQPQEMEDEGQVLEDDLEEAPAASNVSILSRSDNTRLPTPDDTPPYNEVDAARELDKSAQTTEASSTPSSPEASETSPASLRAPSTTDVQTLEPQETRASIPMIITKMTPVNQMSSPVQEPQSLGAESVHEKLLRPALSPIVRAGRALQSVTSDPPSPDRVERQLGSPFRSSVSKESWSGSKESQNSRRMSASSPRQASVPRDQPTVTGRLSEDPFTASTRSNGQPGFMQALARSMMSTVSKEQSPFRASAGSSMRISHPGDEMSWVADEGPLSPRLRGDNTLKDTVQLASSAPEATPRPFSLGQIDGAADDVEDEHNNSNNENNESEEDDEVPQAAEDETDIWEFEARRDVPASTRQQPFGKRVATSVQRRRGLPSPWKNTAAQSTQRRQGANESPVKQPLPVQRPRAAVQEPDELAEYSMLAQQQQKSQEAAPVPESTGKSKPFDLASFFSSPAAFPGMLAKKLLPSKPTGEPDSSAAQQDSNPLPQPQGLPTSSMFPQTAQPLARKVAQPASSVSAYSQQVNTEQEADDHSTTSAPEQSELPTVTQKQNFTPNPKQPNQSFFQGGSARSAVTTPPRMQLSHADIQRWQQETSNASDKSSGFRRPLLRPLPPKNASPTKSSLRSPLKPHTPGRVVEFTSSVLSPVEQARARMERRHSNSTTTSRPDFSTQATATAGLPVPGNEENHTTSDVSMTDASPASKPARTSQQPEELLSQTVWTRQHWLLLDALLQLRRQGPFDVVFHRGSDKFLGKSVKSHGEAMRLERWHLDCVDAFKAEVGGWDEAVLVKRLFALLLGEERRRRAAVQKQRTVMFH